MIVYKHKKVHVTIFYLCYFLLIAIPHTTNIGFDISKFTNINIAGKTIVIPFILIVLNGINTAVSYTHLDVYKRQVLKMIY